MWGANMPDGSRVGINGADFVVESADRSWSASRAAGNRDLTRVEVRHGDTWSEDHGRVPPKERSEFDGQQRFDGGTDIWVSYSMLVEDGPLSSARWTILGQFHHVDTDVATTTPYSVWLNPGDHLSVETWSSPEDPLLHNPMGPSVTIFKRSPLHRNQWYHFVHRVRFGHDGSGEAQLWIDGAEVAHYKGPLGYVGKSHWKFGVYRESAPETIAVQYADMEVGTASLAARIKHPKPVSATCAADQLPRLPLPTGAKVIGLGDSAVRINHAAPSPTRISSLGIGQLVWARALDPRFTFDTWAVARDAVDGRGFDGANQGLDGDHTVAVRGGVPGVLSRIPYVLAREPAIVYLQVGTNDINSHETAASVEQHLDQIMKLLRAGHVWVVLSTIWPRATAGGVAPWPAGDRRWQTRKAVNAWINAQRDRDGVRVVDANPVLTDMAAPSGEEEWRPGYSSDGVHPAPPAAHSAAVAIDAVLGDMIASGTTFATDPRIANLIPDGTLTGTRGTASSGIVGAVADNWSATLSGADGTVVRSTVEASKEVIENGLEKQVFVVRPRPVQGGDPNSDDTLTWAYAPDIGLAGTGVAEGDWIQAAVHADVSAWDAQRGISMTLLLRHGREAVMHEGSMRPFDPSRQHWPASAWNGWLLGEPVQIPPGANVDNIRTSVEVAFDDGASDSGTVKFSRPIIRKVADPRRLWNLED